MKHSLRMAIAMIFSASFFFTFSLFISKKFHCIGKVNALESSWRFAPSLEDGKTYVAGESDDIPYTVTLSRSSRPLKCSNVTLDGFQVNMPNGRSLNIVNAVITFKNCSFISEGAGYGFTFTDSNVTFIDCTIENKDTQNSLFSVSSCSITLISCNVKDNASSPVVLAQEQPLKLSLTDTNILSNGENTANCLIGGDVSSSLILKGSTAIAKTAFPINAEKTLITLEDFTGEAAVVPPQEGDAALANNSIKVSGADEQTLDHLFLLDNEYAGFSLQGTELILCLRPAIQLLYGDDWQFSHRLSQEEMKNGWLPSHLPEEAAFSDLEIIEWINTEDSSVVPFGVPFSAKESKYEAIYDEKNILKQMDQVYEFYEETDPQLIQVTLKNIGNTDITLTDVQLDSNDFVSLQMEEPLLISAGGTNEVVLSSDDHLQKIDAPVFLTLQYTYHRNLENAALKKANGNIEITVISLPVPTNENQKTELNEQVNNEIVTSDVHRENKVESQNEPMSQTMKPSPNTMGRNLLPDALIAFGSVLLAVSIVVYELKHL